MPPSSDPPEKQLKAFLAKYTPDIVKQTNAVLDKMRTLYPGAIEMVYDNYNALVIGFGPTEKPSEAIFSVVPFPQWVTLCFLQWNGRFDDPHGLLRGSGNIVRNIRLDSPATLDDPRVRELMEKAIRVADIPFDPTLGPSAGRLIIRSVSVKQRPRRP